MRNTADGAGGKTVAIRSQSISGVSAINPLVATRHPRKTWRGAIPFFCPAHHTRRVVNRYWMNGKEHMTYWQQCGTLPGVGPAQREGDGVGLVAVEDVEAADGQQRRAWRCLLHAELVLRVPEPWLPLVHVQHGNVHRRRVVLQQDALS
jgi:hypothetical protein